MTKLNIMIVYFPLVFELFFYLKLQEKKHCSKIREILISDPNVLIVVDNAPEFAYSRDSFK